MECDKYHTLLQLYYYYLKLQISIGSIQFIILNEILQALIASIFLFLGDCFSIMTWFIIF